MRSRLVTSNIYIIHQQYIIYYIANSYYLSTNKNLKILINGFKFHLLLNFLTTKFNNQQFTFNLLNNKHWS